MEFYSFTLQNPESVSVSQLASELYAQGEILKSEPQKLFDLSVGSAFEVSTSEKLASGVYVRYDPQTISVYPTCFICDFKPRDTRLLALLCPREEVVELLYARLAKWFPIWKPKIGFDSIANCAKIEATVTSLDASFAEDIESMLVSADDLPATRFYQQILQRHAKGFSGLHLRIGRESGIYPVTLFENGKLVFFAELTEDQPPSKGFFEDFCALVDSLQQIFSF